MGCTPSNKTNALRSISIPTGDKSLPGNPTYHKAWMKTLKRTSEEEFHNFYKKLREYNGELNLVSNIETLTHDSDNAAMKKFHKQFTDAESRFEQSLKESQSDDQAIFERICLLLAQEEADFEIERMFFNSKNKTDEDKSLVADLNALDIVDLRTRVDDMNDWKISVLFKRLEESQKKLVDGLARIATSAASIYGVPETNTQIQEYKEKVRKSGLALVERYNSAFRYWETLHKYAWCNESRHIFIEKVRSFETMKQCVDNLNQLENPADEANIPFIYAEYSNESSPSSDLRDDNSGDKLVTKNAGESSQQQTPLNSIAQKIAQTNSVTETQCVGNEV